MAMALLTSMGKLGKEVLAHAFHKGKSHRPTKQDNVKQKGYRAQVQEVLSTLNSESPINATWECGVHLIHYMIHEDFAYLILCENSLSDSDAFERLADLIRFKTSFVQNNVNMGEKDRRRKFVMKKKNTYQQMFDDFYTPVAATPSGKVIKTPQFVTSEDESDIDSSEVKKPRVDLTLTQTTYRFLCSECGFRTMKKSSFDKHSKINCAEKKATLKCPENDCDWYSVNLKDLDTHMSTIHGREFEVETKEMKDESELEEFLIEIQTTLHSSYIRRRGQRGKLIQLTCSRSGQTPNKNKSRATGKRKIKALGSNKSDKICTSRIIVKVLEGGRLSATFHKTHSGHTIEPQRLAIPNPDKIRIAQMLRDGMTKQEVIKKIQYENCNEVSRLSLINRQDVDNIVTQFKLGPVKFKPDGTPGHSRRPKNEKPKVRFGFEGNDPGQGQDEDVLIHDNAMEIEHEFGHEEVEIRDPHSSIVPSENTNNTVTVASSDMDKIRTLFSTVYGLVQSQNDVQVVENALETTIALLKNNQNQNHMGQIYY